MNKRYKFILKNRKAVPEGTTNPHAILVYLLEWQ